MRSRLMSIFLLFVGLFLFLSANSAFAQSAKRDDVTIVVVSDINDAYGSASYSQHVHDALGYIEHVQPDLVICAGDMVAGQNLKLSEDNIRAMWKGFDEIILQRLRSRRIPFAFTFGNHDGSNTSKYAHERKLAGEFWQKNRPELNYIDGSSFPNYYSFALKGIFIVSIDASTSTIDRQQRDWLRNQLMSEASRASRVRVVVGHLPHYAISQGRNNAGDVLGEADELHAMLSGSGADYYISGHHHAFYISSKDNLKMLSAGALGGGPRKLLNSDAPPVKTLTTLHLVDSESVFRILTHDVSNGMQILKVSDLPEELHGCNGISRLFDPQADNNKALATGSSQNCGSLADDN